MIWQRIEKKLEFFKYENNTRKREGINKDEFNA